MCTTTVYNHDFTIVYVEGTLLVLTHTPTHPSTHTLTCTGYECLFRGALAILEVCSGKIALNSM